MSQSKYASLLFPPKKFHIIGLFRFPVYNDLVPGEAKGIEDISRQQAKHTFELIKLAKRISKDRGIPTKDALDLLSSLDEDNQDILYDYGTELEAIQRDSSGEVAQKIALVTFFIQHRGQAQLPRKRDWQKLDDWTEADTEAIPRRVMEKIFELFTWERDGWPAEEGKDEEPPQLNPPQSKS